jgi:glutaredoxin 3
MMTDDTKPKWTQQATKKLIAAFNRADELGGEVRDYVQEKVAADPRYVAVRRRVARLFGRTYESREESTVREVKAEARRAAAAAPTQAARPAAPAGFGDPTIKAQIFGKKSCPWSGRAITVLERNKVDFDFIDLDEPEHETKLMPLSIETKQHTVPFVFLRGQFVGGFNALAEIERLGQLEYALMSKDERASAPAHLRSIEIVPRPNTDEVAPAEQSAADGT